ncbi:hypothetical protein [Sphingomonas sp. HMP6]|uniref:hypothetical protein n=1 Tax=Sphingomonas sp. HMP6 TaxID=1517551 RepID=UPI001596CDCD|nr:hypothetical protein [Sphingomonas sp. HMP6]BCA57717.1 hypothetical protein HMP06_0486 [Sphingomonas sp. HMP6]
MAHPKIIQQRLLDWIAGNMGDKQPLPTDLQIAERFNLPSLESARGLLADLADAGKITIKGFGPSRVITLGHAKAGFAPARPVSRSVSKPLEPIEDRADKMRRILGGNRPAPAAAATPGPRFSPAPVRPECKNPAPAPAPVVAPHPIVGLEMPRPPVTAIKGPRHVNVLLPGEEFAKLDALAEKADVMPGRLAREQMILWLNETPPAAAPPTIIPASIASAAIRDGFPVIEFARRMMVLGLAAYAYEMVGEPPC